MSILIKGMKMPKTCQICRTAKFDRIVGCEEWDRLSIAQRMYKRSETCPLVPVPPHGRLIDADACEDYFFEHLSDAGMAGAMNAIEEMPTIIPADDGCGRCDHCRIPQTGSCRYGDEEGE